MKAAQINEYGDPSVIHVNEVERPVVKPGQVGVTVHAASLNPFDTIVRSGRMQKTFPLQFPATLGGDFAGIVAELGAEVTNVQVGDKVYGQSNVVSGSSGALAEYVVAAAGQVAELPKGLDFKQAAALPLVGVSALQALEQHIKLQPGQKIFIHGGAGGIGTVAIQIAKHLGAYVATTATGDNIGYVKQLGADEVIDYKTQDFAEVLKNFDAVFDTVGGDEFNKSLAILKPGGVAVSMIAQADQAKAAELGVTAMTQGTKVTTEALGELRDLVDSGVVTPHVGQVFPLDEIRQAFTAREAGTVRGTIVVEIVAD